MIRSLANDCELISVRVLAGNLRGNGEALYAALEWAVAQRFPLINGEVEEEIGPHVRAYPL